MKTELFPKFQELYEAYRNTEMYELRVRQFAVAELNKEIIIETLRNEPLQNVHLTGFIQMFKYGCTDSAFDKYLVQNVSNPIRREEITSKADQINEWGYTGAGKNAIVSLSSEQLESIKIFINKAFEVNSIEEAINLCQKFDAKNIPLVKSGIYSPWLYYINPKIFPILNNSHIKFRNWIGMPADYPSCIRDFNELNKLVGETELGLLDNFAHHFEELSKLTTGIKVLNLNGKRLFKMSHGVFVKDTYLRNSGFIKVLEERNWISLHKDTGKGQGKLFENNLQVGDYVYVCYGGDELYCVAKIISDSSHYDDETDQSMYGDGKWRYRIIEPLFIPKVKSLGDLKGDTRFFMPSGNSTLYEVPKDQLDFVNSKIFTPKCNLKIIDTTIKKPAKSITISNPTTKYYPMNTILYGSPGTGKTFHSISHSVAIVENKTIESIIAEERELVKNRFDQYVKEGQIVFCTFHQSMGYEDFIEGIKPIEPSAEDEQLSYAVEDGVFKRLCTEAAFSYVQQNTTTETEKVLDFSTEYDRFVDSVNERFSKGEKTELPTRSGGNVSIESISQKNNIWVRHIDGNRNYTISKKRLSKISQAFPDLSEVTNINDQFRAEIGGSNSSAYWAVLNAIRNQPSEPALKTNKTISEKEYSYDDKKEIIESLNNDDYRIVNPKRFVLIIDEINRGNVSQIFGELITLIEEDKRLGKDESLKAILPYSKENFGVPCNLHIVGTMNTADRSVEALDTALRRRFSFVSMAPKPDELSETEDGIDLPEMLRVLNSRLSILKDDDHTIGHAWLWDISNIEDLKNVFGNKILPLLQEYFYNDYEKLGLVLGDAFFEPHVQVNSSIFASFSGGNGLAGQYDQSWNYKLKSVDKLTISDFQTLAVKINQEETGEE